MPTYYLASFSSFLKYNIGTLLPYLSPFFTILLSCLTKFVEFLLLSFYSTILPFEIAILLSCNRVSLATLRLRRNLKRADTSLGSQSSRGRREQRLQRQPWIVPGLREPSREQERVWWQGGEPLVGELSSKPGKLSGLLPGELAGKLVWDGAERGLREKERESVAEREIAGGCCESQDILREEKVGQGI